MGHPTTPADERVEGLVGSTPLTPEMNSVSYRESFDGSRMLILWWKIAVN
jgi:hypothetical protein